MKFEKGNQINKGREPWNKGKTGIYSKETLEKMRLAKLGENHFFLCLNCKERFKKNGKSQKYCKGCHFLVDRKRKNDWLKDESNRKIHYDRARKLKEIYLKEEPEKIYARNKAQKIKLKEYCEICKMKTQDLSRHHWRYDKPLLVNTLCRDCHEIQHIKNFNKSYYNLEVNFVS